MKATCWHGKSDVRVGKYEEGEDESGFLFEFQPDDIPVCLETFDILLYIDDLAKHHLFSKTITVKQKC